MSVLLGYLIIIISVELFLYVVLSMLSIKDNGNPMENYLYDVLIYGNIREKEERFYLIKGKIFYIWRKISKK